MDSDWIQTQALRATANAEYIGRVIDLHHPPHDNLSDIMLDKISSVRSTLDTIEAHINSRSTHIWYDKRK